MPLRIDVTWPQHLPQITIPVCCSGMTCISLRAVRDGDDIVIRDSFGQQNRVCDDDRYRICRETHGPLECCQPDAPFERTLVILLESPHEQEYVAGCIDRPVAPALGTTGRNIRNNLMGVVRSLCQIDLAEITRVILANPIQFQCSLASLIHHGPKSWQRTRDAVWKTLWRQPAIREECRERLQGYHADFILNACTHNLECDCRRSGGDPECKKQVIREFLRQNFPCVPLCDVPHPSSRHFR